MLRTFSNRTLSRSATKIEYDHKNHLHTVTGAKAVLELLFQASIPNSLLDVGCGNGVWLRAALDLGVPEIYGVDGVPVRQETLLVPQRYFSVADLSRTVNFGKIFDMVLCMEVAEHLPADAAPHLIKTLVSHSNHILFSAACPGQNGQHHVNCQWPRYWQDLFNERGYACDDGLRWTIWDHSNIEPWYRQNVFAATRAPDLAGREPRIRSAIHPEMLTSIDPFKIGYEYWLDQLKSGNKSLLWYSSLLSKALCAKVRRRIM